MKAHNIFKNLLRTMALAGLICILPVFSNKVQADDNVIILDENGNPATVDDYEKSDYYASEVVYLKRSGLTIVKSTYPVIYQCDSEASFTIKGEISVTNSNLAALLLMTDYPVTLYVDGECTITGANGITSNSNLSILPKNGGDSLTITADNTGINLNPAGDDDICINIGDGIGSNSLKVSIESKKGAISGNSSHRKVSAMTIYKDATLECKGGAGCRSGSFIDEIHGFYIYGTLVLDQEERTSDPDSAINGAIKLKGNGLTVGPYTDIRIMSKQNYAVLNSVDQRVDSESLNACIVGSEGYTDDLSDMKPAVFPAFFHTAEEYYSSWARVGTGEYADPVAHSIVIRPFRTVKFAYDGIEDVKVIKGGVIAKPDRTPTDANGGEFEGWYKDNDLKEKWNFDDPVNEGMTLYPGFSYTVTFNSKGGSKVSSQSAMKGKNVNPGDDPTKENYDFAGWYTDEECTKEYDFTTPLNGNITLYAKWVEKAPDMVKVIFKSNGGTYINPKRIKKGEKVSQPKNPEKDGCIFMGWYADIDCTEKYDFDKKVENDITLYAKWDISAKPEADINTDTIVDYDTFKSEYPSKTVIAKDSLDSQMFFDMKVHHADAKTIENQKLLAQYLIGANAQILLTENIYPRRDLATNEDGKLQILIWNNLPKNQEGPISAVVYNQIDGAYVINGYLDDGGTATFIGYKMRSASSVAIASVK